MDIRRLVIVDGDQMVSEALSYRLGTAPDLYVAGHCASDDPRLAELIRSLRPDVIMLEGEQLGLAVGEIVQRLIAACPTAEVVVLGVGHDAAQAVEAARAGADAWVGQHHGADQLETVIRGVCEGRPWFPPDTLGAILRALREDISRAREHGDPLDMLSPREREVMASMADGKGGRQIAEELLISTDTVRTHIRSILSKLDVHSSLEAVCIARSAGLRPAERAGAGRRQRNTTRPRPPERGRR
ncbi:MAG: LuxR C-terminal-related transcriptional regulator [Streptosporangiaceae bacterium]